MTPRLGYTIFKYSWAGPLTDDFPLFNAVQRSEDSQYFSVTREPGESWRLWHLENAHHTTRYKLCEQIFSPPQAIKEIVK
jgi:hypothetical protein